MADRESVAPVRTARGRPVASLMLLAACLTAASHLNVFAEYALVLWLASFAAVCVALVLAVREMRATRKR